MSASCIITSLTFILLLATICCQLIAFLTSHMISNNFDSRMHEGIYQRCGLPFNSILGSQTNIGAYFGFMPACSWWNSRMFEFDPGGLLGLVCLILRNSQGQICTYRVLAGFSFTPSYRHLGLYIFCHSGHRIHDRAFELGR